MDSSSIVKLYISEPGSTQAQEALARADSVATVLVAYAEVRAALASARRSRRIRTSPVFERRKRDFDSDWQGFLQIAISQELVSVGGDLAERHALSGFDAMHLAAALALRDRIPDEVQLSTWDRRLAQGARSEGLSLAHEVTA